MKRAFACQAAMFAGWLALAGPVWAVLPPAAEVLARSAAPALEPGTWALWLEEQRDGAPPERTLRIVAEVTTTPGGPRIRCRFDEQDLASGQVVSRSYPSAGGAGPPDPGPIWLRLLLGADPRGLAAEAGIRIERTSYSRLGEVVLWVLGAGPQEPERPQWQIERGSGRLRVTVERDGTRVELHGQAGETSDRPLAAGQLALWPGRVVFKAAGVTRTYAVRRVERGVSWPPGAE